MRLHSIIIKKGGSLTHEVVLCLLTKYGWEVQCSYDLYIAKDLAEAAARSWSCRLNAPYLGIKDGFNVFPYDEEEYRLALIELGDQLSK